jgi:hypothetical protein
VDCGETRGHLAPASGGVAVAIAVSPKETTMTRSSTHSSNKSSFHRLRPRSFGLSLVLVAAAAVPGCGSDEGSALSQGALATSTIDGALLNTGASQVGGASTIPGGGITQIVLAPQCVTANPNNCQLAKQQETPPPPPMNYVLTECTYEVELKAITMTDGQGISESKMEIHVSSSAGTGSVRWPSSGDVKMEKSYNKNPDQLVATHVVQKGQTKTIEICATVTETDTGGFNGAPDVGQDCAKVTLECNRAALQAPPRTVNLAADLCRGNKYEDGVCKAWNGRANLDYLVTLSDRDWDGVPAPKDMTPDPEDEACRGQEGRGVVLFSQYGASGLNDLIGQVGMGLDEMVQNYDFVAIAIDPADLLGFTVRAETLGQADMVVEPTLEGLLSALRGATSRGFDVSLYVAGHGGAAGTEAYFTSADADGLIDEAELRAAFTPQVSGTCALPFRMVYGIPCYFNQDNDLWMDSGSHAATGARFVNPWPQEGNGFARHWNNGDTFQTALSASFNPVARGINSAALEIAGRVMCVANILVDESPLGLNACSEWFFTGGLSSVNFDTDYDHTLSGLDNLVIGGTQVWTGQGAITKFNALTWQ